ncbi:MAG: threonine ammonia-lyase [Actinomycetota bacterium]
MAAPRVSAQDIEAAQRILRGVAIVTPVETSRQLSAAVGGPVVFKCENLQRTGSFKIRGAYVRIANLTDAERAEGVVAASAGNHAQGVALAARLLGTTATVFMPEGAPLPKVAATKSYGALVRMYGARVDDALTEAIRYADECGKVLIHPFDHADIIAGQGTVGLEILEAVPEVATVVVPVGGGGLIAGMAVALKAANPAIRIVGVQAEGAASFEPCLKSGKAESLVAMATIADGIAVARPGVLTLDLVGAYVDEIRTVSDESLSRALLMCLERAKLVVEPAGVAAVAAIQDDPSAFAAPVVAVLSGGNVDPLLLLRIIRHGLAAAGRYVSFRLRMPDRPGELARVLEELASRGANVLEVEHVRTGPRLHLDEVEVELQLETNGPEHSAEVVRRLEDAGYRVTFG